MRNLFVKLLQLFEHRPEAPVMLTHDEIYKIVYPIAEKQAVPGPAIYTGMAVFRILALDYLAVNYEGRYSRPVVELVIAKISQKFLSQLKAKQ